MQRAMKVTLSCALAAMATPGYAGTPATGGIRPGGADPVMDCSLRDVSLEFSQRLFPNDPDTHAHVFDALQLGVLCNRTRPAVPASALRRHVRAGVALDEIRRRGPTAATFVVSADGGDDARGDGSVVAPFATLYRGLAAAREAAAPGGATVVLRGGTHFLGSTVTLGPLDVGLTITSVAGEEAVVSGGTPVSGLKWAKAGPSFPDGVYVADVPANPNTTSFDVLFVGDRPEIRARWPNGDPETTGLHTTPTGWATGGSWAVVPPTPAKPSSTVNVPGVTRPGPDFDTFGISFDGLAERYSPAMSKWGGTPRPTSITSSSKKFGPYSNVSTGVLHAFHGSYWGGWQFRITGADSSSGNGTTFSLDPWGGQQEARGDQKGAEWRLDNLLEELDSPREWFHDEASRKLYYFPANGTAPPDTVVVASLKRLVHVGGGAKAPVSGVALRAIKFAASAPTFLDAYEVPSGGDWSIHRGGAVFAEGVDGMVVDSCTFEQLGGNALFLSGHAHNTVVSNSEFAWIGDSAVAAIGYTRYATTGNKSGTDLMDGTDGNQPRGTVFSGNVVREIGIYGKQTSAFVQSIACNSTIRDSVMFNGPRAGINFNDGFGGGNLITNCLTFNWVRETADHGNFNSWDRLPYLTETTGVKSTAIAENRINNNLMWNNYHSTWPIDHDDGSCFYLDEDNFMIYGGAKNYLGHSKVYLRNYYVYADLSYAYPFCIVDDSLDAQDTLANCTCIHTTGGIYNWQRTGGCGKNADLNRTVERVYDNRFFTSDGDIHLRCADGTHDWAWWQAQGYDGGSTVAKLPPANEVVGWARDLFRLPQDPRS